MDESGEHHSQQTDTRTENEILHILTHRWVMSNENTWTQGREHHTPGSIRGNRGGIKGGKKRKKKPNIIIPVFRLYRFETNM